MRRAHCPRFNLPGNRRRLCRWQIARGCKTNERIPYAEVTLKERRESKLGECPALLAHAQKKSQLAAFHDLRHNLSSVKILGENRPANPVLKRRTPACLLQNALETCKSRLGCRRC